ncbi:MAG: hypothetical protein D6794_06865 [Deltaproteobacteria bacterium]|nr:MAG: hypothetical protein D6794_06865 [Deltaproteobacteria bacterium]
MCAAELIDISHWQDNVDYDALAASGLPVYVKATDGDAVDELFRQHAAALMARGVLVGAYHFLRAGVHPDKQWDVFANEVEWMARQCGDVMLMPMLDIEERSLHMTEARAVAGQEMADDIRATFGGVIIYSAAWYWDNTAYIPRGTLWQNEYLLWVAHYTFRGMPRLPAGWNEDRVAVWQYGIGGRHWWARRVPGVRGECDRDRLINGYVIDDLVVGCAVPPDDDGFYATVSVPRLNVRAGPGTHYRVLGQTTYGTRWKVEEVVLDHRGRQWYRAGDEVYLAGWLMQV